MKRPAREAKTKAKEHIMAITVYNHASKPHSNNEVYGESDSLKEIENEELFLRKKRRGKRSSTVGRSRKIRKSKKKRTKSKDTPKKRTPKVPRSPKKASASPPKRATTIKQTVKEQKELAKRGRKKKPASKK